MKATARIKASLLVVSLTVAAIISCNTGKENDEQKAEPTVAASQYQAAVTAKSEAENNLYQAMADIDNNLELIRQDRGIIRMRSDHPMDNLSKKKEILSTIGEIRGLLTENKKRISKLQAQLAHLKLQKITLSKEAEEVRQFIAARESELAAMQEQVLGQEATIAGLNKRITELQEENASVAQHMDAELHKAYYVMGNLKELKEHNIVEKKGGILGLGGTKELKPGFEKGYFTEIDTRQVTTIPVNSKKAYLVTNHPAGSYTWEKRDGNTEQLAITDPEKFWGDTKYLVVEVK